MLRLGFDQFAVQWMGIAFGILKLAITWLGLELYLDGTAARRFGLALAVVLPVNIHMDGMLTNEIVSTLFATATVVVLPKVVERSGRARWYIAILLGGLLGLQMLSKISALICMSAIGVAALFELATPAASLRARIVRALPWSAVVVVPLLISGWYFVRNIRDYSKPFVSSFDFRPDESAAMASIVNKSYFARRPGDFVFGWSPRIFQFPYVPVGVGEDAHFSTVAVASTFVDYWNVRFSGLGPGDRADSEINGAEMSSDVMTVSRMSIAGGTILSFAVLVAWCWCAVLAVQRRQPAWVGLLAFPALAFASGVYFATTHPFDWMGVIKSSYLQFGMAPLFGVAGLAAAWTLNRRATWPLFVILIAALWLVAAYSVWCRFRFPLLPGYA
ncbi:MAG: hypothetical protein IPJ65_43205 [Archangiaceae bacterium]|nr:hypothetical protein [Archangiaceae bacterium]